MMRAFDMSRYQRVIATEGRVRGEFVVHAASRGVYAVHPINVTLYDETHSWGRIVLYGDFSVNLTDGVPTVGTINNPEVAADIEAVRGLIDETLALVVRAFEAGVGSVVKPEAGDIRG